MASPTLTINQSGEEIFKGNVIFTASGTSNPSPTALNGYMEFHRIGSMVHGFLKVPGTTTDADGGTLIYTSGTGIVPVRFRPISCVDTLNGMAPADTPIHGAVILTFGPNSLPGAVVFGID